MLTPAQVAAARVMLGWTRQRLEQATRDKFGKEFVSYVTIGEFERGETDPHRSTMIMLQRTLEAAGIIFLDATADHGPGLMLRDAKAESLKRSGRPRNKTRSKSKR